MISHFNTFFGRFLETVRHLHFFLSSAALTLEMDTWYGQTLFVDGISDGYNGM